MTRRIDLTNQTFGELKVVKLSDKRDKRGTLLWECECSCSKVIYVPGGSLRAGIYKSCGCKRISKRDVGVMAHIASDTIDGTRKTALNAKLHKGNKSGHKGVIWLPDRGKYKAYIGIKGKNINLGYFVNKEDAIAARLAAEEKYHKPFLEGINHE